MASMVHHVAWEANAFLALSRSSTAKGLNSMGQRAALRCSLHILPIDRWLGQSLGREAGGPVRLTLAAGVFPSAGNGMMDDRR